MTSAVTPTWGQPAAHPTPATPTLAYQAAHTGRPPGTGLEGEDDGWGELGNSSLVVEEGGNFSLVENFTTLGNKTLWPAGQVIRLGVEVQLFPDWVVGVWTGVLVTLMVVGVSGNVLVPVVVMRTRDLRSSTNLLLVNLAAADLLVLLVSLPTALTELHSRPETWVLGEPMCKLVPFVEYCVCHASVLTILVISFERYYAICRPLRASYTCTKMRACTCILTIWASAVILSCPMLVMSQHEWAPYADGTTVPVCYTELTSFWACLYINLVTAIFFFVPLVLLILLYLVIGRSLMQDSASAALQHRKVDLPNMKARRQVVVMLATVTIFFFISLFPFRVLTLWIVWTPKEGIETVGPLRYFSILYATRVLLFANSAVNPILYNLTSTKFREAFLKLLSNDRRRRRHLSRQSTFNTTGTSMSNGRSGSSRTIPTDLASVKDGFPARVALARCGRHASFDDFTPSRPNMARYGRQSSFAGTYCFPSTNSNSSSAACSRQNSRAGENGVMSPLEPRRSIEGEKRHSGEGRRLLEGERPSTFGSEMIEEEKMPGGLARMNSIRRDQENVIAAEMERLLSDGDNRHTSGGPSCVAEEAAEVLSLENEAQGDEEECEEEVTSGGDLKPLTARSKSESISPAESTTSKEDGSDTIAATENGKSVQFRENLSTKVSVV